MKLWYLATPYTYYAPDLDQAFRLACEQAALFIEAGIPVFCPIAHSHPIAVAGDLDPCDHEMWLPADEPLMGTAFGLIVCRLMGWRASRGIAHEIEHFRGRGKPVLWMIPGRVPVHEIRAFEGGLDSPTKHV